MEVHIKTTVWTRLIYPDEVKSEDIIKEIESGTPPFDLVGIEHIPGSESAYYETIYDTEEYITPEENDGQSTIEVVEYLANGNMKVIWDNSFESEARRKLDTGQHE